MKVSIAPVLAAAVAATAALLLTFAVPTAGADPSPTDDPACSVGDPLLAVDAGCTETGSEFDAAEGLARAAAAAPVRAEGLPPFCHVHVESVFWTVNTGDWLRVGDALAANPSPCADYYISIPPQANDKTLLRGAQDELVRALGPHIHPVAEMTLGTRVGWLAKWIETGHSWFSAGVEFRRRMAAAGYRFDLGETWLLNEFDVSTRRDEPPYSRAAMKDLLRGLYYGDGTGPTVPGIVEIGIAHTHQNIPDVEGYKAELKEWLQDSDFWSSVDPYISVLTKEVYGDARFWGVAGTSRNDRTRHLTEFMEHPMNLVRSGSAEIEAARNLFERAYMPLGNATWPALGPDPFSPPFCCGHGWTMIPLDDMLSFVSEQIYAVRHYAQSHPQGAPAGRLGFSYQPVNNFGLPPAEFAAAQRAILARIASAIRDAYGDGGASSVGACFERGGEENWCRGADVPGAVFTDAWQAFEHWQ
jgi:hypothetical protein